MTLWRKPKNGDTLRYKHGGALTTITRQEFFDEGWLKQYGEDYEFVSVTPIEQPPEPLRRTVYVPVYKQKMGAGSPVTLFATSPVFDAQTGKFATDGKRAAECVSGFEHLVGVIKVELVEGQYDD